MNVAIYVRVSTQQQAEHGYSLQTQIDACKKKAEEIGASSIKIYKDDGFSGAFLEKIRLQNQYKKLLLNTILAVEQARSKIHSALLPALLQNPEECVCQDLPAPKTKLNYAPYDTGSRHHQW